MKNFGLSELYLVAPRCAIDHRAEALASHADDVLAGAVIVPRTADALAGRTFVLGTSARTRASEGFAAAPPREAVKSLPAEGGAVVFGPEDTGLTNEDLDRCQAVVRIPTAEYASLNLAQAVNLIAYEWFLHRGAAGGAVVMPPGGAARTGGGAPGGDPVGAGPAAERPDLAPREELEAMYAHLMATLRYIGYTDELRAAGVEHMFRRLFDRAGPTSREVAALRGIWSQARWAADQPPEKVPGRQERP